MSQRAERPSPPPFPLPYKVDTSRPSLRTNWTCGGCGRSVCRSLLKFCGRTSPRLPRCVRALGAAVPHIAAPRLADPARWHLSRFQEGFEKIIAGSDAADAPSSSSDSSSDSSGDIDDPTLQAALSAGAGTSCAGKRGGAPFAAGANVVTRDGKRGEVEAAYQRATEWVCDVYLPGCRPRLRKRPQPRDEGRGVSD